ncbi:MAG: ABC transporter ATP-binding protein [Proteobacteria bacterium]|nr:ABC transporter ATP-binding protein [Pseudomonadota bacterium]
MIDIEGLHVVFNAGTANENHALRGLDLHIAEGRFVSVIGSNGAGKSTLLNALAGDVAAAQGRLCVDGRDITRVPTHARSGLCARVFQDPLAGTCGPLTIEENLALADDRGRPRSLRAALDAPRRARYRELLAPLGLGLEQRLGDRMELLSGGQRQAVSLLMATMRPSRLLLLDEMTAALDPTMATFVMELTRRIVAERRLTVLMVTHSMAQALAYGDRTLMMHRGQIVLDLAGEQRASMTVERLVEMFGQARAGTLDQDSLLL